MYTSSASLSELVTAVEIVPDTLNAEHSSRTQKSRDQ